jgi:hypothetical protein
MSLTAPLASNQAPRTQHWLQQLQQARQPLSKKELFGKAPNSADNALLAQLLAEGSIVNLAKNQTFALVSREDALGRFAPLSLARQAVLSHLGLGLKPLALTSSTLDKLKGVLPFVRPALRQAVMTLVNEGQLIAFKHGNTSLVMGVAGVRHQLAQVGAELVVQAEPAAEPATLSAQALRQAYAQVLPAGGSMVEIGALHRALGGELAELHAVLRQLLAERQLFLILGEPSLLPQADRAAALLHEGRRYHCVELRLPSSFPLHHE